METCSMESKGIKLQEGPEISKEISEEIPAWVDPAKHDNITISHRFKKKCAVIVSQFNNIFFYSFAFSKCKTP